METLPGFRRHLLRCCQTDLSHYVWFAISIRRLFWRYRYLNSVTSSMTFPSTLTDASLWSKILHLDFLPRYALIPNVLEASWKLEKIMIFWKDHEVSWNTGRSRGQGRAHFYCKYLVNGDRCVKCLPLPSILFPHLLMIGFLSFDSLSNGIQYWEITAYSEFLGTSLNHLVSPWNLSVSSWNLIGTSWNRSVSPCNLLESFGIPLESLGIFLEAST